MKIFVFTKTIYVLTIFFLNIPLSIANTMKLVYSDTINSTHIPLSIKEYKFKEKQRGKGGALLAMRNSFVVGTSERSFIYVDLNSMKYKNNFLPDIDAGEVPLKSSKRYKVQELAPRIEDLIFVNGSFYTSFTKYNPVTDYITFDIARCSYKCKEWDIVWESTGLDNTHYSVGTGGKMAFKGGKIYFTVGNFSLDGLNGVLSDISSQNLNVPWGKVNTLNIDTGEVAIFTLGHRNPQGLVILKDGRILSAEHGPSGGDEVNELKKGKNYGWPYESYGTHYGSYREYREDLPPPPSGSNFEDPLYAFVPSPALSQLIEVSSFHPKWNGDLLIGSLKAKTIFRLKLKKGRVIFSEPIPIQHRIRDLKEIDGKIVVLTDEGSVLILTPDLTIAKPNL